MQVCAPRQCNVGLLAYSPLSGGALTGKYINGDSKSLEKARFKLFQGEGGYAYLLVPDPPHQGASGLLAGSCHWEPANVALRTC